MATINAGRVRPYHRGAWSNSVKYSFFDLVTNGGSSYLCINTSGAPAGTALSNGTYWALLAEKGDTGPQGAKGATGSAGTAATITIGTVTTGAAGTSAVVTNVGTATAAKLNFTIPRGATGARGPQGPSGAATVSEKGTRTTSSGNWTITGLTVNKPLYLIHTMVSGSSDVTASWYIVSGAADMGNERFKAYKLGTSAANVAVIIPTSTSVVLNVTLTLSGSSSTSNKLTAYQ